MLSPARAARRDSRRNEKYTGRLFSLACYWVRTLSDGNTRWSGRRGAPTGHDVTARGVPVRESRTLRLTMYRPRLFGARSLISASEPSGSNDRVVVASA